MKIVTIKSIELTNFKGVKYFKAELKEKENFFRGKNGSGKSTVEDALSWLLTGKNKAGESDTKFNIKTLDENNNPIHKLNHAVKVVFIVDGTEVELERNYHEKWVKQRGSSVAEFSGHTTDYYIDSVKSKESKYNEIVSGIMGVDYEKFMMLSNPLYFLKRTNIQDRRKILCEMAETEEYETIIQQPEFEELTIDLNRFNPEEYLKHCKTNVSSVNKQLDGIPHQVKVIDKLEAEIIVNDFEGAEKEIESLKNKISENNDRLKTLTDDSIESDIKLKYSKQKTDLSSSVNEKEQRVQKLESDKRTIVNNANAESQEKIELLNKDYSAANAERINLESTHNGLIGNISALSTKLPIVERELEEKRAEFKKINEKQFKFTGDTCCSECGRDFEDSDIAKRKEISLQVFTANKSKEIFENRESGMKIKSKLDDINNDIQVMQSQADEIWKRVVDTKQKENAIKADIDSIRSEISNKTIDTTDIDKSITNIKSEITELNSQIEELKTLEQNELNSLDTDSVKIEKENIATQNKEFEESIEQLKEILAKRGTLKDIAKQRTDIDAEEKKLSEVLSHWNKQLNLTEELIKKFVTGVEGSVNSMFKYVKFKLFEIQQNGGVKNICDALVNGVPATGTDLNTAGIMNAGIDIVNTFSKYYEVRAPIVIDNRESITDIIDTECQVINLIMDKDYNELTQVEK